MPFPLSKVRRLGDYRGEFALSVLCLRCRHERAITSHFLPRLAGRDALVENVARRFRCSKCGGRKHEVLVIGISR